MAKRILALCLVFTLLFSCIPFQGFAQASSEKGTGNSQFLDDVALDMGALTSNELEAPQPGTIEPETTEPETTEPETTEPETTEPETTEPETTEPETTEPETTEPETTEPETTEPETTEPETTEPETTEPETTEPETTEPGETEPEWDSVTAPEGYQPRPYEEEFDLVTESVRFPDRRVLLIEDNLPWNSTANHTILNTLAPYDVVKPSQIGQVDVTRYSVVILANDQTTSSYTAYARFADKIEEFVENGGVVVFGAADGGWSNGYMGDVIPGGVKKISRYTNNNCVTDATHPIVTGILTDNKVLTDAKLTSNYCSHVYFQEDSLPLGSRIILREVNGYPTLVEYPLGNGRVIASGLTWEHNYARTKTFAPIAMDDLYTYALYTSNAENPALDGLYHNKIKDTDHMILVADAKTKNPLEGATISFGSKEYQTDEKGTVLVQNVTPGATAVVVTKKGYQSQSRCSKVIGGDIEYFFLEDLKDANPYIVGAMVEEKTAKSTKSYDLLQDTVYADAKSEYKITILGDWQSQTPGYYMLYIGDQYACSSDGVFTIKDGVCSNSRGENVTFSDGHFHVRMVSKDGKQTKATELGMYMKAQSSGELWGSEDTLFSLFGKDGLKITIPKELPVIGGLEFQVELDEIPVSLEITEDTVKIAIGKYGIGQEKDPEKAMADWQKKWETLDRKVNLKKTMDGFGAKSGSFTLKKGWDTDLDIIGYAEGKFNAQTNEITGLSGGFIIQLDLDYKYNQQFLVGSVPLYFEIGGGVEAEDNGKVQGVLVGAKQLILDNELTITPKFHIGGGVGIHGALSIGAEGTAKLPILLCKTTGNVGDGTLDVYSNVSLEGEMDLTASALFVFNARHKIAEGTWQIARYYWNTGEIEWFEADDMLTQSVVDFTDPNSFSLLDRSYLFGTGDWYTENLTTASFQDGMTILQTGVMPTTDPQIVSCSDGTAIMVFQQDDPTRSALNRSRLMYSVLSNGVWSSPQSVWDNGCADMAASLATGEAGTYVLWQKLDQVLPDTTTLEAMAAHVEIAVAKYDPATGSFVEQAYVTDDNLLQMMPALAVGSQDVFLHYVTNESNQLLGGGTNKIIRRTLSGGQSETLYSGGSYVTCMTADMTGGGVQTAYILDMDGSLHTADDTQLYKNGQLLYAGEGAQLHAQYSGGTLYWYDAGAGTIRAYSGGSISQLMDPDPRVGSDFQIFRNRSGKQGVVWLGITEDGANCIYAKVRNGSGWSAPVELVTSADSLVQLAGFLNDFGSWELVALAKSGENSANLLYSGVAPYLTTRIEHVTYIPRNRSARYPQLALEFVNGSEQMLTRLNVDIYNAKGEAVYSQSVPCQIFGGEHSQLLLDIDMPVQTEVAEYTVRIYPEGETNLSDNEGTISVGYTDLVLLMNTRRNGVTSTVNLRIFNDSDLESDAVLVVREGNAEDGMIVDMRSIDKLAPGETYTYTYQYNLSQMDFGDAESKTYYYQVESGVADGLLSNNQAEVVFHNPALSATEAPVEITVNVPIPLELTLDTSATYLLEPDTLPEASRGWVLHYTSLNPEIATVDDTGLITAVAEGETTIVIQAENTEITKEISVVVLPPVARKLTMELRERTAETDGFQVNDQYDIEIRGEGERVLPQALFAITSSKPDVARVEDGVMVLCKPGSATITATYQGSKKLSVKQTIKVTQELVGNMGLQYRYNGKILTDSILTGQINTLKAHTIELIPTAQNQRGEAMEDVTYTFQSNNTAVAKVDKNGIVTATGKEGIAVICIAPKGSNTSAELTIYAYDTGAPILIADKSITVNTYMTTGHPDAPKFQLQAVLGNKCSVDSRLYQKGKDSYTSTDIQVNRTSNNGTGLNTYALGCSVFTENLKSGTYYIGVSSEAGKHYLPLSIKISKKQPDVRVQMDSLNVFFSAETGKLNLQTKETITSVSMEEVPTKGKLSGGFSLRKNGTEYCVYALSTLRNNLQKTPLSKYNTKYQLRIWFSGYNTSFTKSFTVAATYKLPVIKLNKSTLYAASDMTTTETLSVKMTLNGKPFAFAYTPSCYVNGFPNKTLYVQSIDAAGNLRLYLYAMQKGTAKGQLLISCSGWCHSIPVNLTVSSQYSTKNCKVSPLPVNVFTGVATPQAVTLGGKQVLGVASCSIEQNDLFSLQVSDKKLVVVPLAEASAYKKSQYTYQTDLSFTNGIHIQDLPITIRVSKTQPKLASTGIVQLFADQRGRIASVSLKGESTLLDLQASTLVIKKGKMASNDLSAAWTDSGVIAVTCQQPCTGTYTLEVTPVLHNGQQLKLIKQTIKCTNNASASAAVSGKLDIRKHLDSRATITLTLKNTSAVVEKVAIEKAFRSQFEILETLHSGKNTKVILALKDGMSLSSGSHSIPLLLTMSDGSTLNTQAKVQVICSKLAVTLPSIQMVYSAKRHSVIQAFQPVLKDGATITGVQNADNKSPFQVSYADGVITVSADKRYAIRKGSYTVNCVVFASNDAANAPGTVCKLKVVVK